MNLPQHNETQLRLVQKIVSKNVFVSEAETIYQYKPFLNILQKLVGSHIEIKSRFCKHDLNFMNSGVNSLIIALLNKMVHVNSFQPKTVGSGLKKGLKIIHDITKF